MRNIFWLFLVLFLGLIVPHPALADATSTEIIGRYVFYNNSAFDDNDSAIYFNTGTTTDDLAVDYSKSPLMSGAGQASFFNYTAYDKGINGLMFDIKNSVGPISPGNFSFDDVGKDGNSSFGEVSPTAFLYRPLTGQPGTYRIVISLGSATSSAPINTWLKVTISGMGLPFPEVHYWGNAAGDTGLANATSTVLVNATDEIAIRNNRTTIFDPVNVSNFYDINRDGLVNPTDEIYVRNHPMTIFNGLKLISR